MSLNSIAMDIGEFLSGKLDKELNIGSSLFIGDIPTNPDKCLCIWDNVGGRQHAFAPLDEGYITIFYRGYEYNDAYNLLNNIKLKLESLSPEQIVSPDRSKYEYTGIWVHQNIGFTGNDAKNRKLFNVKFRVIREYKNQGLKGNRKQ